MADPRLRIGYPDGNVRVIPLPAGPCVGGRKAHDWEGRVDHPPDDAGAARKGVVSAAGAECAVCHGVIGETLHPPVEGKVTAEIV